MNGCDNASFIWICTEKKHRIRGREEEVGVQCGSIGDRVLIDGLGLDSGRFSLGSEQRGNGSDLENLTAVWRVKQYYSYNGWEWDRGLSDQYPKRISMGKTGLG